MGGEQDGGRAPVTGSDRAHHYLAQSVVFSRCSKVVGGRMDWPWIGGTQESNYVNCTFLHHT